MATWTPTVGDVVQLVRTLPRRWLESPTVTAQSPKTPDVSAIVFKHLHESRCIFRSKSHHSPNLRWSLYMWSRFQNRSRCGFLASVLVEPSAGG
jgi:hypothetical protein